MLNRIIENGSVASCPCITCFGRQYGSAARTPCTVAVYKSARLPPLPSPTDLEWLRFFAAVGSDVEFVIESVRFFSARLGAFLGGLSLGNVFIRQQAKNFVMAEQQINKKKTTKTIKKNKITKCRIIL